MIKTIITSYLKTIILLVFSIGILLLLPLTGYAMYNGSPDWHAPKKAVCKGIPDFPNGMEVITYEEQVFGSSFDRYIFIQMNGALGLYYFEMELQNPRNSNNLEGTATQLYSSDWSHKEFKVNCTVSEWHREL